MKSTDQQLAIYDSVLGSESFIVKARAGTGKSTTARESMRVLREAGRRERIRYICFNRSIADEFSAKAPAGVDVGTMHSLGKSMMPRGCIVDKFKSRAIAQRLPQSRTPGMTTAICRLASHAKNQNLNHATPGLRERLLDLAARFGIEPPLAPGAPDPSGGYDDLCEGVAHVLRESLAQINTMDFDDMIWLPVQLGYKGPAVDLLYIDECQDLSPVQVEMVRRFSGQSRIIPIGDDRQAIYGWRGADLAVFDSLATLCGNRVLPLTLTFRCPKSHVDLAREIVPDFQAHESNPVGTILRQTYVAANPPTFTPGTLVQCRYNAPLVGAALATMRRGMKIVLRGGPAIELLNAAATYAQRGASGSMEAYAEGVRQWRRVRVAQLGPDPSEDATEAIADAAATVLAVAEMSTDPVDVWRKISELMTPGDPTGAVIFSSIHRSKGTEADNVAIIETKPGGGEQESNVRYVSLTRSRDTLLFLESPKAAA